MRGASERRVLTDLGALVRHATEAEAELVPYPEQVRARDERWLRTKEEAGRSFTPTLNHADLTLVWCESCGPPHHRGCT